MGGGGKIQYPKHVWSPAGGWYSQPANWKANTAVFGLAIFGITAFIWKISAEKEHRTRFPDLDTPFPSRYWAREIIDNDKKLKEERAAQGGQ